MNVDSLIEGDCLACFTSFVTLASREITDGVQILISSRTVSRIDLDPMTCVQRTACSDMSFDAIAKTNYRVFDFGQRKASPITAQFGIGTTSVIKKSMIVSPTMTGLILSHYVKRTTLDNRTVFVTTQIDQIVAIVERKCHVVNSCMRC